MRALGEIVGYFIGAAMVLSSGGCTETIDIQTEAAYGPGIKLTGLGDRYAWASSARSDVSGNRVDNPEVRAFIVSTVDADMSKRGFSLITEGRPDFWLVYHVVKMLQDDWDATPFGTPYPEGTLVLEVVDPSTRQLIWRGVAKARIDPSSAPSDREKRISAAVAMLMSQFPPRSASGRGS
jgi:hypothetical protein